MTRSPDPRFGYALRCAMRRMRWLFDAIPHADFAQQISLALAESPKAEGVELARVVDRCIYDLARAEGFARPSCGLKRGKSGGWRPVRAEIMDRAGLVACPVCGACVRTELLNLHTRWHASKEM